MAKRRNCPNCGAPYETNEVRCPYCGTAYFDMSMINMDAQEPFFLKIQVHGMLITQKVIPTATVFESDEETVTAYGGIGNNALFKTPVSRTLNTDLTFRAIAQDREGVLATIKQVKLT